MMTNVDDESQKVTNLGKKIMTTKVIREKVVDVRLKCG